jgi:hypothetical protein
MRRTSDDHRSFQLDLATHLPSVLCPIHYPELTMFASTIFATFALASTVHASYLASYAIRAEFSSLDRRATQVPVACYVPGPGDCACPEDLNSDVGVLINVFPVRGPRYRVL